jgi:hypothetical protein
MIKQFIERKKIECLCKHCGKQVYKMTFNGQGPTCYSCWYANLLRHNRERQRVAWKQKHDKKELLYK